MISVPMVIRQRLRGLSNYLIEVVPRDATRYT